MSSESSNVIDSFLFKEVDRLLSSYCLSHTDLPYISSIDPLKLYDEDCEDFSNQTREDCKEFEEFENQLDEKDWDMGLRVENFLNKHFPNGKRRSKPYVYRRVLFYIIQNDLMNDYLVYPDNTLCTLLEVGEKTVLSLYIVQRLLFDQFREIKVSGFCKYYVSPRLTQFMGLNDGTLVSIVQATRKIVEYIKEKNLQDPLHVSTIFLDDTLRDLFDYHEKNEEGNVATTFPGIQKLLHTLFI